MWKGVTLTLICFLVIVVCFNIFHERIFSKTSSPIDEQTELYREYLEDLKPKNDEQFRKVDAALEMNLRNQERFQKLLERWEAQSDRIDSLISQFEKKN
jgi:hypothetical protein